MNLSVTPSSIYDVIVVFVMFYNIFILAFVNKKLKLISNKKHTLNLPDQAPIWRTSENILSELRALIDADRITLLRFHNGQEFLPNNPVWKLTGDSCVKADGVSDEVITDLIISRIPSIIEPLITGDCDGESIRNPVYCEKCMNEICSDTNQRIVCYDVEKMSGYSQSFFQKRGTGFAYIATICNSRDEVFGMLLVEYTEIPSGNEKNARIVQNICKFSTKLNFLFK